MPLLTLLLITIPARLIRFVLLIFLVWWLANRLPKKLRLPIAIAGWSLFYLGYFLFMPS